ncbi:uncharacterized protein LOC129788074, partial [Lutzomyia longipalpis]|uniref:uncharacterized protein LOC129788074 n=1 Tax=Lutzomyia longipalpis TaxID=7200 RepID=UPI002483EAA5
PACTLNNAGSGTLSKSSSIEQKTTQQSDKDPRDVSANGFNRFDPKYISIGPKAIRGSTGMSAAAAAASKCATLRQGGRYGGSLGGGGQAKAGTSPCLNFKTAQPPTVATVSKDYTNSYSTSTLSYSTTTGAPKKNNVPTGGSGGSSGERKEEGKQQQAVYSIDTSYRQQQSVKSQESTATKGISILNQPLPEIPHSAMKATDTAAPKNTQQPLCAANLNQYRSLQRPGGMHQKSSTFANQPPPQQTVPLKSSMKQPQAPAPPPKVVPPQLPPKNRHKDPEGKSHQKQSAQSSKGQNFNTLQYPSKHHQGSTHTTFGYDNKSRDFGGGSYHHGYQQSGAPQATGTYDKKYSMSQQQYESSRMTSFHGGDSSYGYPMKASKSHQQQQGYQTMPHQPKHQQYQQSSGKSHSHHQSTQQQSSKQGGSRRDDPPVYYRSLQRGGANTAGGAHNDLYSVTEL